MVPTFASFGERAGGSDRGLFFSVGHVSTYPVLSYRSKVASGLGSYLRVLL
jgi:hypothetical protein